MNTISVEPSLHETLNRLASEVEKHVKEGNKFSEGYRALAECLPAGLSEKQQAAIKKVVIRWWAI